VLPLHAVGWNGASGTGAGTPCCCCCCCSWRCCCWRCCCCGCCCCHACCGGGRDVTSVGSSRACLLVARQASFCWAAAGIEGTPSRQGASRVTLLTLPAAWLAMRPGLSVLPESASMGSATARGPGLRNRPTPLPGQSVAPGLSQTGFLSHEGLPCSVAELMVIGGLGGSSAGEPLGCGSRAVGDAVSTG
jgi:hypothetical protein